MEEVLNTQILEAGILKLPARGRLPFLLSCVERLLPNYAVFSESQHWGDPATLRGALDLAWSFLAGEEVATISIEDALARCEAATPDTENFDSPLVSAALDAAVCTALVLELLRRDEPQRVIEGALLARDTVDMHVQELEDLDPGDPLLETKILAHPLMQREIARQAEDLELLHQVDWTRADTVSVLRREWREPRGSNIGLTRLG